MTQASEILALMPGVGQCRTIAELAQLSGIENRSVVRLVDTLRRNGLVERETEGCYRTTAEGWRTKQSGAEIKPGPKGPLTGRRRPRDTLRQRAWDALYRLGKFSINDVLQLAQHGDEKAAQSNLQRYFLKLRRAGVIAELPVKEASTKPTSNGFKRYRLMRRLGPVAPNVTADGRLYDRNSGQDLELKP